MAVRLLLQDFVPYDAHFGWLLAAQAYVRRGLQTWTSGEVPAFMTGNSALAMQILHLWETSLRHSELQEPLAVLELGAGNGLFAWHLIQAHAELSARRGRNRPLHYYLSDRNLEALQQLRNFPAFEVLLDSGQLRLLGLDLLAPSQESSQAWPSWDLMICNYLLCQLPFRLLRWHQGGCQEAWLSTSLRFPERDSPLRAALEAQPQAYLQSLEWLSVSAEHLPAELLALRSELWSHLDLQVDVRSALCPGRTEREQIWWQAQLQASAGAWLPCPVEAFQGLAFWLQGLKDTGLFLLSDKGRVAEGGFADPPQPYGHGQHASWPVAFPLLAQWLRQEGFQAGHSQNALWTLHHLWALRSPTLASEIERAFRADFECNNANQAAADLIDAAEDYLLQQKWRKAAMLYHLALRYRPRDGRVTQQLVACLIELQAFEQAETWLKVGADDLLQEFDFDFQWGQVHLFQGRYLEALTSFERSLERAGPDASCYYNLGLSQMLLQRFEPARANFEAALALEPEFELARLALESWHETLD